LVRDDLLPHSPRSRQKLGDQLHLLLEKLVEAALPWLVEALPEGEEDFLVDMLKQY